MGNNKKIKQEMIIEASHIDFGGGLVLLEVLLKKMDSQNISSTVYIKNRDVAKRLSSLKLKYAELIVTNTTKTIFRYMVPRKNILFFCNLPPFNFSRQSILFIHNVHLVVPPDERVDNNNESLLFRLKKKIYFKWIKYFINNVSCVACQTTNIQKYIKSSFNIDAKTWAFFEEQREYKKRQKKYDFCYIASGVPHKNHENLLKAFGLLLEDRDATMVVTIPESYSMIINEIKKINSQYKNEPIKNLGFVEKEDVGYIYESSKALIFPSLAETLGLPLIEAIQHDLKVLSSDLDFSYNVVGNPITFDPNDESDILLTMKNFMSGKYNNIDQYVKLENNLNKIINFFKKQETFSCSKKKHY